MTSDRCRHAWCRTRLHLTTDDLGRVYALPCPKCSRRERNLCWSCDRPPVAGSHFCGKCRYKRNQKARLAANHRAAKKDPKRTLARAHRAYARRRRTVLGAKRFAIAQHRERKQAPIKTRPCPECPGIMTYRTRPPERCPACWTRRETLPLEQLTA